MKSKEMIYVLIQKISSGQLEDERVYLLTGEIVKEFIGGNFQKINRNSVKLFANQASFATVYSKEGEYYIRKGKSGILISMNQKRADPDTYFNLRNPELKEAFINFISWRTSRRV